MDQWNAIEIPNKSIANVFFTSMTRIHIGERLLSSTNGARKIEYPYAELDCYLTTYIKINSKCVKNKTTTRWGAGRCFKTWNR
jgi:hypothetical protein